MSAAYPIPTAAGQPLRDPRLRARILQRVADIQFAGLACVREGDRPEARARVCNLGRGELIIRSNRFLTPGAGVELELECLRYQGAPLCVTARIQWCRQEEDGPCFISVAHLLKDATSGRTTLANASSSSWTTTADTEDGTGG